MADSTTPTASDIEEANIEHGAVKEQLAASTDLNASAAEIPAVSDPVEGAPVVSADAVANDEAKQDTERDEHHNSRRHSHRSESMGPRIPSVEELEHEHRDSQAEVAEAKLVAHVQQMCVDRGVFVFTRPSVLCSAFSLEEDMSPHRAGRWAFRRILIPAATLERAPGPQDESEAKSFLGDVNAAAWSTLTSTAGIGTSVVSAAVDWGSWLLKPAQVVVESSAGYLAAGISAVGWGGSARGLITAAPATQAPAETGAAASATPSATTDGGDEASRSALQSTSQQASPDGDSAMSFGMDEFNALGAAIDEACRSVFGLDANSDAAALRVVFRPALHKIAARVVNSLIERTKNGGALARIMTWDEWSEFILVDQNSTHVHEMTNFLTNHAQVVRPLECRLGRGLFLAAQLSETAESMLWPIEVANALLEHKLRAEQLGKLIPQWEDRLQDLITSGDGEASEAGRKRAAELRDLIAANKLVQIEVTKTVTRTLKTGHLAPKAALSAIEERLEHFGDISAYPISDPEAAKAALEVDDSEAAPTK